MGVTADTEKMRCKCSTGGTYSRRASEHGGDDERGHDHDERNELSDEEHRRTR